MITTDFATTPIVTNYGVDGKPMKEVNRTLNKKLFEGLGITPICSNVRCASMDVELRYLEDRMAVYYCDKDWQEIIYQQYSDTYEYNVNGFITSAGKFEGEHIAALYFWQTVLDGDYSDAVISTSGVEFDFVEVSEEDRELFGSYLGSAEYVMLWETEQGFVHCQHSTKREMEKMIEAAEKSVEDDMNAARNQPSPLDSFDAEDLQTDFTGSADSDREFEEEVARVDAARVDAEETKAVVYYYTECDTCKKTFQASKPFGSDSPARVDCSRCWEDLHLSDEERNEERNDDIEM